MNGDRWARKWLPAAGAAIGVALIALPLLAIAVRGLLVWRDDGVHLSIGNFAALLGDARFYEALLNTLIAGVFTTGFSLVLGFGLAFLVARTDMPARRLFGHANLLPFFLSPYAGALAWTWLLAPHGGLLTTWAYENHGITLRWLDIYSVAGVIFVQTLFYTPYVYLFVLPPLREIDAAFEDTARVHGASLWYTIRHITVPLLLPALLSGGLIVFLASATMLDVPLALGLERGIPLVPSEIYAMAQSQGAGADFGRASAFGVIAVILVIIPVIWQRRILAGRRFAVMTTAGQRYRIVRLGWRARLAALAAEAIYLGASVLLPLAILLIVSLTRLWNGRFHWRAATLFNYHYVLSPFGMPRTAIDDTLLLAAICATCGVALSLPQTWYLNSGTPERRARAELLLYAPLAIAGVIVGLGWLLLAPRAMAGTLGIILIAMLARFLPFVTRNVSATYRTIDPDLEPMARASGGTWSRAMRHIVLPLLRPSMFSSWLVLFAICIRELGTPILLFSPGSETISVALATLSDDDPSRAAALAIAQMLILTAVFAVFILSRTPLIRRPA